jgi:hypothetical protein
VADAIAQRVSCREVQDRFVMIAVKRSSNGGASAETQLRQQPFAMKDQRMDRFCFWIVLTPSRRCLNEESTPGAACSPTEFPSQAREWSVQGSRHSPMTESEWQTRKQRIDTRLRSLHPPWQITHPKPAHTFVYVSTIQRMARNLFGAEGCFPQTTGDADYDDPLTPALSPTGGEGGGRGEMRTHTIKRQERLKRHNRGVVCVLSVLSGKHTP